MYAAVEAVCDKKQALWQALVAFVKAYLEFKTHVANIQSLNKQQERKKAGVAEDKQRLRVDMCNLAFLVCGAVKAYADEIKNRELAKRVGYSRSELSLGRDAACADRCREIHLAATENVAKLGEYGVTPERLVALQAAIDAYATAITKPRETRVVSKTVTGALIAEFKAVDELLKVRLDNLMPQLAEKDPTFAADYANARIVVAAAATRTTGEQPATPAKAAAAPPK